MIGVTEETDYFLAGSAPEVVADASSEGVPIPDAFTATTL